VENPTIVLRRPHLKEKIWSNLKVNVTVKNIGEWIYYYSFCLLYYQKLFNMPIIKTKNILFMREIDQYWSIDCECQSFHNLNRDLSYES
jgi:hypothetical protein